MAKQKKTPEKGTIFTGTSNLAYVVAFTFLVSVFAIQAASPGEFRDPPFGPTQDNVSFDQIFQNRIDEAVSQHLQEVESSLADDISNVTNSLTQQVNTLETSVTNVAAPDVDNINNNSVRSNRIAAGGFQLSNNHSITTPSLYAGSLNLNGDERREWPGSGGTGNSGLDLRKVTCTTIDRPPAGLFGGSTKRPKNSTCTCPSGYIMINCSKNLSNNGNSCSGGFYSGSKCGDDDTCYDPDDFVMQCLRFAQ